MPGGQSAPPPKWCINCFMLKQRKCQLRWHVDQTNTGAWTCDDTGGCTSRYTDNFLRKVEPQIDILLVAMGGGSIAPPAPPPPPPEPITVQHRSVRLDDDDTNDDDGHE